MSWSGPVTGATSFQPPSYGSGFPPQASYGTQQNHPYGQQPGYNQHQNGFTYPQPGASTHPPKPMPPKKKGNPIITRYPPPPGYRGPAQPQGPFGTVQYQTPQQGFPQSAPLPGQSYQGPSPTNSYPQQNYGQQQTYQSQQAFSQAGYQQQNHQWSQQQSKAYPPQPSVSQPPHHPNVNPPNGYTHYPNQPPPINTNQQSWSNAQSWQQPPGSATHPPSNQYSSFGPPPNASATPTPSTANPSTAQPTPTSAQFQSAGSDAASGDKAPLFLAWDDWDFDFDGAIWPKANEPVDPDLSLGVITWRPAKQVTRALPATFEEAEEQSLKPPVEKLGNGESVSMYFTNENSYEAFLDVRRTDHWYSIKDDPVFVVFGDEDMERHLVSIEDCVALRDRPDEPIEEQTEVNDEDMQDTWNVMDNLEQALSGDTDDTKHPTPVRLAGNSSRDQAQEDILARLGVTGSPKPASGEAISVPFLRDDQLPASLPPKPPAPPSVNGLPRPEITSQRTQSYSGQRNSSLGTTVPRPYGSISSTSSQQSPPLPYKARTNSWNANDWAQPHGTNVPLAVSQISPTRSEASNRTAVKSEFGVEKATQDTREDPTPIPQLQRNDSSSARKRSLEDTDHEDEHSRQQDDNTKRKRRSQVDAAYSRR